MHDACVGTALGCTAARSGVLYADSVDLGAALAVVKKPQLMTHNTFVHRPEGQCGCFCGFRGPVRAQTKEQAAQWPRSRC